MSKLSKFTFLLWIITALPFAMHAETITVDIDPLRYTVDTATGEAEVYGPISSTTQIVNLVIPDYINYNGIKYPVTSIRERAFYGCTNVTGSLTIGNSVQTIGTAAFRGCEGFVGALNIPNSVTIIEDDAFWGCKGFTSLTLSENLTSIGNNSFSGCSGLSGSLTIPDKVKEIGYYAFNGCSSLSNSLIIGKSVETIGNTAFFTTRFEYIYFPASLKRVGYQAFVLNGNLKNLVCDAVIPPTLSYDNESFTTFFHAYDADLRVPAESVELYKTAKEWKKFNYINPIGADASGIKINKSSVSIKIGESVTLLATVEPEDAIDKTVIWSSSDESVATVKDGVVKGIKVGKTTITATTVNGLTASCEITVNPILATSVTLNTTNLSLLIGQSKQITANVKPTNTTDATVTWKSSDEAIAKVSADGTVAAVSVGVATITATCGEVSATCKVTVNPVVASSVTLNVKDLTLLVGQSDKLTATVEPVNTTDATVSWKSSNESIAKVSSDGTVTAVSVGVATITATCGAVSASCKVTVNPVVASSVMLNVADMTLLVGQSDKLTPTVEPANTTDATITWKSSDESIATVSEDGTVTAISVGVATITATCGEVSATCKVTVNPPLATGITLDRESYEGLVGESFVLTPTILPVNASKEIKWESLDEDVSTVTENGEVVIIGPGTAIITASTTDGSNLSASCEVTAWLRGDSNGDNMVDVADVVNCINYIADNPVEKFIYIATDLNGDKDITVTDATLIAQLILNSTASSNAARQLPAMRMNGTNNIGYVNVTDKDNFVTLAMSNSGYSAFQTDLILPEGVEFEDARLVNGAKGTHTLMSSVEENRVRLILFSLDNSELKAGETFVELSLKGTHSCYDMISVENSVVSDASAHSYAISARYNGNSSGVSSINDSDEIMIKTTSTGITVLGAINKQINIYSLDGMVIYSDVADSNSESISLNKGTYVVKVGDKVQTVQISNF